MEGWEQAVQSLLTLGADINANEKDVLDTQPLDHARRRALTLTEHSNNQTVQRRGVSVPHTSITHLHTAWDFANVRVKHTPKGKQLDIELFLAAWCGVRIPD